MREGADGLSMEQRPAERFRKVKRGVALIVAAMCVFLFIAATHFAGLKTEEARAEKRELRIMAERQEDRLRENVLVLDMAIYLVEKGGYSKEGMEEMLRESSERSKELLRKYK